MAYPMRKIWEARNLILRGYSVTRVCGITGMNASSVYAYTKSERQKMKQYS